jgi:di/tricarboxylate transporter
VAKIIGTQVLRFAGHQEARIIFVIMLSAGTMSAFMNNIGVAALMLPVVMDIAKRTGRSPSRLLMPLAFGCLLGGLTTLIGTPPNLLISYALEENGLQPFQLFDFTPVGLGVMLGGILFVALIGRHLLPDQRKRTDQERPETDPTAPYALQERVFQMLVKPGSALSGKALADSKLRSVIGLNVLAIIRPAEKIFDPEPRALLRAGDRLVVQGRLDALEWLRGWKHVQLEAWQPDPGLLAAPGIQLAEARLAAQSPLLGKRLRDSNFRTALGLNILAIQRDGQIRRDDLPEVVLDASCYFLLLGKPEQFQRLAAEGQLQELRTVTPRAAEAIYHLRKGLFLARLDGASGLVSQPIAQSQFGSAFGLNILGIIREDGGLVLPAPEEVYQPGDRLIVRGNPEELAVLKGIYELEELDEPVPDLHELETDEVRLSEVVLAPRSAHAGKTLKEIRFREKYGLTALALWREGRVYQTGLDKQELRFGDSLLVYGKRHRLQLLGSEPDFIVLSESSKPPLRTAKAGVAALVMAAVLLPVLFGIMPLAIAAVAGVVGMVLTGCLRMEEAYRAIEWRSVFLIAGMLPLGTALQKTGAAELIAGGVVETLGPTGPWGVLAGLYLLTVLGAFAIPSSALVVLMAPIALQASASIGMSPYAVMMALAMASASLNSPIAHPANLLVMGPGGYRFIDYLKLGLPLTLVVIIITFLLLPVFWPL